MWANIGKRLAREEDGAALVEYGLLVALIAVVCLIAVTALGNGVKKAFENINAKLPS